jgi:uncharacterized protein YceK
MKKLLILIAALALAGCASVIQRPPPAVLAMPTDCANRVAIVNWLTKQSQTPRQFEPEQDHENRMSEIRQRIWHIRYHCQPV